MSLRLLVSAFMIVLALAGCRQNPVYTSPGLVLQQPLQTDVDVIRERIARAGEVSKWEIEFTGDNTAVAKRNFKNKHYAQMELSFDRSGFQMTHKSSRNFNYDGKYAHPTYNRFVQNLHDALSYEYRQLSQ